MIYLGSLGRMIGIKCPASQQAQSVEQFTFKDTVEGRVKAQRRPLGRRSWSLRTSDATTPGESAILQEFAAGAWGRGPFVFVSADAPHTNLLTPGASTCDPAEVAMGSGGSLLGSPPLLTPDGWAARSVWKNTVNGAFFGEAVPVLSGRRVTGSAYVSGAGGFVRLVFLNASGAVVSQVDSAAATPTVARRSVTALPPVGAVSARLTVTASVTAAARPAITWTDTVQPYSDGQGCSKAVVHGVSRDQVLAVPGNTFSNLSFTVTEVG